MAASNVYAARAQQHAAARDVERRRSTVLSRWRLATVLPALAILVVALDAGRPPYFYAAGALFLAFGVLVVRHARVDERAAWFEALRVVNERAVARIGRHWDGLPPGPAPSSLDFETHPYAGDLDLFGRASIYQWLGPAATELGAARLAGWLLAPALPADVRLRQEAVEELASLTDWRESLAAHGEVGRSAHPEPIERFLAWAESSTPLLPAFGAIRAAVYTLTGAIAVLGALHAFDVTPAFWPIPVVIGIVLSFATAVHVHLAFSEAGSGQRGLKQYAALLGHLESVPFTSPRLRALQQQIRSDRGPASDAMRRLNRVLGFSEMRAGAAIFHFVIQALTLWDFHVLFALDRWRQSAGRSVRGWLEAAAELDALSCLAAVRHDNPEWAQPVFVDEGVLRATGLGHPLIADDRRVGNDVTIGPPGTVLLITGSNMSGKSTLLRAIGLNAVLAQAGAPVCATSLQMPPADLATSIRIQDSLEHGVSYFMAALARLKRVVDNAEREAGDRVLLYLLDEILQGTNSLERGIAVQAVARHLLAARAIGAITTHDLGVAADEPLRSHASLVHFTETVDEAGNMGFDYTLRPGLATSRNALRLMKLIGID